MKGMNEIKNCICIRIIFNQYNDVYQLLLIYYFDLHSLNLT